MGQQEEDGQDPPGPATRIREEPRRRLNGASPRTPAAAPGRERSSLRWSKKRPASAAAASTVVSTMAIALSPFKREKTIWVVRTRNVPPKR